MATSGAGTAERARIDAAIDGQTLCSVFAATAAAYPDRPALAIDAGGVKRTYTWSEYRESVRSLALGLRSLGVKPGEFAVVLCRNRPEHAISDMGVLHAGATPVSLYATLSSEQIAYIAGHCEARVAIVEDRAFLGRLLQAKDQLPNLEYVLLIDPDSPGDVGGGTSDVLVFDEVLAVGRAAHERDPLAFDDMWQAVDPDGLCTLIYTSGTTGPPKGVMNTHRNILWNLESIRDVLPMGPADRVISYLPLAHAADRFLTLYSGLARGFVTHSCPDITQIAASLTAVRPTFFGAVPRVWEKLHAAMIAAISREPDEARRSMVEGAIAAGRAVSAAKQSGRQIDAATAEAAERAAPVLAALRTKIGLDECHTAVTGAAPTPMEVLEFFDAIGIGIAEVWGMSELSAVATMNPRDAIKLGTIGRPLPGVELSIAEDGELLVNAGLTMRGYYKEPVKTAETMAGGWLHTGDVATADDENYYRIVDRKKELIITAGGKNISPANLEGLLKEHPLIGQACVIGDNKPYLSALIVLDGDVAPGWASARGIESTSLADLSASPEILDEIGRAIGRVNERVSRVESIRRWTVLSDEWTVATDELTPTMKLKRRVVHDRYRKEIDALYERDSP